MGTHILLTGAAGIVGTALRPFLREQYDRVILSDLRPIKTLEGNESFEACDIADLDQLTRIARQANGIIHLAGMVGANYSFDDVLQPNIVGTYNVYRAAHSVGISNVVYASSHHALGFMKRGAPIHDKTPHRPDSHYGLSKAFGESAGSYFCDNFGLNVLAIRIGFVGTEITDERRLHTWISPRDLAHLIHIGLSNRDLGYEVVYGTSNNPDPFFDNSNATRLGYCPEDRAIDHISNEEITTFNPEETTITGGCVGGGFAAVGFKGNPERTLRSH
ncbi:NAD(P)-dependent oxidoreductase [Verrucomicrobia bacterium]|nr:NAD(P)-dependent oxidoreductase [bacterium]MDB4798534.1 NAD(P)-dependent oxidoreductase [Verrucomicrobiota bacterium]